MIAVQVIATIFLLIIVGFLFLKGIKYLLATGSFFLRLVLKFGAVLVTLSILGWIVHFLS
ncbi:hypothetical protein [Heyndrickxia sporothermodurans]|uniref:hypothetical protein n=1 Tax=Heyndrickxia sporothermodurans TaxID=46224 RepID=UPI0035D812A3